MDGAVDRRELKGIGGWLVLFQIYIIMAVFSALESLILFLMGRTVVASFFEPYYIVLLSAVFALALVCMVLFYCRKMVFRPMFVAYAFASLGTAILYTFYKADFSYNNAGIAKYAALIKSFINTLSIVSVAVGTGIIIAFIIALYKSQRVKNTFSTNNG